MFMYGFTLTPISHVKVKTLFKVIVKPKFHLQKLSTSLAFYENSVLSLVLV